MLILLVENAICITCFQISFVVPLYQIYIDSRSDNLMRRKAYSTLPL